MLRIECLCPRYDGERAEEDSYERFCVHCGDPVLTGDARLWGPEGFLHTECLAQYAFLDVTRDELLDFAETRTADFVQYVTELRNFRTEEGAL